MSQISIWPPSPNHDCGTWGQTLVGNHKRSDASVGWSQVCTHLRRDFASTPRCSSSPIIKFSYWRLATSNPPFPPQIPSIRRLGPLQDLTLLLLEATPVLHLHVWLWVIVLRESPSTTPLSNALAGFNALALTDLPLMRLQFSCSLSRKHPKA